jgi:hypothetical protein
MKSRHVRMVLLSLCAAFGCSRAPEHPVASDAAPPSPPVVSVAQPLPEKKIDAPVKDIAKARQNPEIIRNNERGIVRGEGVANAVVWLKPLGKTTLPAPPTETVGLSVEKGGYRPHLAVAQKGSVLELRTVDERADFQASGAATFSEILQRGMQRTFPLSTAGPIEVRSQLHPDRAPAYVWVLDGVPGTVSDKDGRFRLPPIPAGEYELVLEREKRQAERVRLTLGVNEGAEVRFSFPPSPGR